MKLWQGCGKNPDFTAKTDAIDNSQLSRISNLRVCNAPRLHPAYRLIRQLLLFLLVVPPIVEFRSTTQALIQQADIALEQSPAEVFWIDRHIQTRQ